MQQRPIKIRAQHRVTKEWRVFILPRDLFIAREDEIGDHENYGEFTGLLDKNGKEIYEGDIVRRYGSYFPLVISCLSPSFVAGGEPGTGHYFFDNADEVEVIGKIHENADLLESGAPVNPCIECGGTEDPIKGQCQKCGGAIRACCPDHESTC